MSRRKRKEPTLTEKLAAALAMLLPDNEYKGAHGDRLLGVPPVSAKAVIRMFTFDHCELHAHGGADTWDNLTPRRRGPELKAKDIRDTKIAAKSKRILKKWKPEPFDAMIERVKRKRTIPSRPFQKQHRKLQSRGFNRRSNVKAPR